MSGQPAARIGDMLACATPQATPAALPHAPAGMPISAVGAATVFIGNQIAARMTDFSLCPSPVPVPNLISRGAFPVPIMNLPAARMTDMGTAPHTGVILPPCCPTVLIGLAGTAGNIMAGTAACNAAAAGRTSNTTSQTYNNCGVESSRQLINRGNPGGISENALLQQAINSGQAGGTPGSPPVFANGGTNPAGRQAILAANGVPSTVQNTTLTNMGLNASAGRGQIVSLDAAPLWGGTTPAGSLHAVVVTGVVYDDAGNVTDVVINDTGTGQCGQTVPIATFNAATSAHPASRLNVTNAQVW